MPTIAPLNRVRTAAETFADARPTQFELHRLCIAAASTINAFCHENGYSAAELVRQDTPMVRELGERYVRASRRGMRFALRREIKRALWVLVTAFDRAQYRGEPVVMLGLAKTANHHATVCAEEAAASGAYYR